jgi:hypothetical protein
MRLVAGRELFDVLEGAAAQVDAAGLSPGSAASPA